MTQLDVTVKMGHMWILYCTKSNPHLHMPQLANELEILTQMGTRCKLHVQRIYLHSD